MEDVIVLRFAAIADARQAIRAVHRLHETGAVRLAAASVVGRREDGRAFALEQPADAQPGVASGGEGDGLVGLLTGPFGVVLHNAPDALVGALVDIADVERSDRLLRCFGDEVPPGSIATIALLSETRPAAVDALRSSVGGVLVRRRLEDVELKLAGAGEWTTGQPRAEPGTGVTRRLSRIRASLTGRRRTEPAGGHAPVS